MNSRELWPDMGLSATRGRGIRVAVLDSGINALHSHVRDVAGGVHICWRENGQLASDPDYRDVLGHGTAVAGVIRAKAPEAQLYAVRVFDRELRTHAVVVAQGIRWAIQHGMHVVNISLGTERKEQRDVLKPVCDEAARRGVILVAASENDEREWFPASFPSVIAVAADATCAWDELQYLAENAVPFRAHPCPRPLPGRPQALNLRGHSFAAAHITARIACILEDNPKMPRQEVVRLLLAQATNVPQSGTRLPA